MMHHVAMPIKVIISRLKKDRNPFEGQCDIETAMAKMLKAKKEGYVYWTGCNNMIEAGDKKGMCAGHEEKKIEKVVEVDLLKEGTLLPPKDGLCPECAVAHQPEEPHNQQSLYYQMSFKKKRDRWPTWKDAIAHCTEEVQEYWTKSLAEKGVKV